MRRKKARIIQIVVGISLNGKITDEAGDFQKYSSPEDQAFLRRKIKESDVLIMGRKTFEKHVKRVGVKPTIVFTRHGSHSLCHSDRPALGGERRNRFPVSVLRDSSTRRLARNDTLKPNYFCGSKAKFIQLLNRFDYRTVTVLGGAEIYHWFIQQDLVTDAFITVEPYIFGAGKNFLQDSLLNPMPHFQFVSAKCLNDRGTMLLHYQP